MELIQATAQTKAPGAIMDGFGLHNLHLDDAISRLDKSGAYKDLSTVIVCPSRGQMPARVVQNWLNLMKPMNQKVFQFFVIGLEIGAAYNVAVDTILNHPDLKTWKYMLTMEDDNIPPADGLLKLLENMEQWDVVGGLYWTKGEGGMPMIYGNPQEMPLSFRPQRPIPDSVQPCNGLGMGFTLFKIDIFKDPKIQKPFFQTVQGITPEGAKAYTQDLHFFEKIHTLGYKVACDTKVKVGHYDLIKDTIW
jgi:hypothetical protein